MATSTVDEPRIGEGIYSFHDVSRILRYRGHAVTPRQIRSWITTGLVPPSIARSDRYLLLAFDDLISLEVVRRFRSKGQPLQRIRKFEAALRALHPERPRPFAYRSFFMTDGASSVWFKENPDDELATELVGKRKGHRVWAPAIMTFAEEIHFDPQTEKAESWMLSPWVEIDPAVQFGAPVVRNTRVPISTVASNLRAGTVQQVADWYELTVDQVKGVRDFLALEAVPA